MQVLVITVVAIAMLLGYWIDSNRNDPTNTQNLPTFLGADVAENLFFYTVTARQYAETESSITESTVVNTVITDNDLVPYLNYSFTKLGDYTGVILTYLDAKYLLVSWNTLNKTSINPLDVMGSLTQMIMQRQGYGPSTYWQVPLVGINNNCNISQIFSQLTNKNVIGDGTLFVNLCNQSINQVNLPVGKYFLLEQLSND